MYLPGAQAAAALLPLGASAALGRAGDGCILSGCGTAALGTGARRNETERRGDKLIHLLHACTVAAVVLHVLRPAELCTIEAEADPAVRLPRCFGVIVLELNVDAPSDELLNHRRDAGCVVVPAPSVHVRRILQNDGRSGVAGRALVERVVDVAGSVGAHGCGSGVTARGGW